MVLLEAVVIVHPDFIHMTGSRNEGRFTQQLFAGAARTVWGSPETAVTLLPVPPADGNQAAFLSAHCLGGQNLVASNCCRQHKDRSSRLNLALDNLA